ncbi:MAG: arginine--tRNA ligase, partial [Candidatus Lokiarchaeota archaeon]|nr:arginine--tRNA ligase [Candidatus Lokiarchaeota archaeon]
MIIIDKKTIAEYLSEYITNISAKEIKNLVEIPPPEFDFSYAFPCFQLAKFEKRAPNDIANELEKKMKLPDYLETIEAMGPYLNFRVKPEQILQNIFTLQEDYGRIYEKLSKTTKVSSRIVIEYPSPNTNKP